MTKALNEGFRPYTAHLTATDVEAYENAALILEAGGSVKQAMDLLGPQHMTGVFHVDSRPAGAILRDAGTKGAIAILRKLAEDTKKDEA